jgi:hypothetical protein
MVINKELLEELMEEITPVHPVVNSSFLEAGLVGMPSSSILSVKLSPWLGATVSRVEQTHRYTPDR